MNRSIVPDLFQRYARAFFLALCLLQSANSVQASEDLTAIQQRAEQGDAKAQFNLGVMYRNGRDVAKDAQQAVAWYRYHLVVAAVAAIECPKGG